MAKWQRLSWRFLPDTSDSTQALKSTRLLLFLPAVMLPITNVPFSSSVYFLHRGFVQTKMCSRKYWEGEKAQQIPGSEIISALELTRYNKQSGEQAGLSSCHITLNKRLDLHWGINHRLIGCKATRLKLQQARVYNVPVAIQEVGQEN